jgi:hypothetical protein
MVRDFVVIGVVDWRILVIVRSGREGFLVRVDGLSIVWRSRSTWEVTLSRPVHDAVERHDRCYDPENPDQN